MNYEENAPMQSAFLPLNIINYIEALLRQSRNEHVTLLDCPVRYTGEYSLEKIEHFLNYVRAYKTTKNISDEQSLRDLPHLLQEHAYRWWKLHENEMKTWQDAVQKLHMQFSHVKHPHIIYKEIYANNYNAEESFRKFVCDKVKLFEQLSSQSECTEQTQLDIIYGLLPLKIQNSFRRRDFISLKELVEKVESFRSVALNGHAPQNESCKSVERNVCKNPLSHSELNGNEADHYTNARRTEDGEPFIKVRCSKDLMPQIKEEEHYSISLDEQGELKNSNNDINQNQIERRASIEPEFNIDAELMNQITNIIDNCDPNVNGVETSENHLQATSTNGSSEEEPSPTTSIKSHECPTLAQTVMDDNAIPINDKQTQKRHRCNFCRSCGHTTEFCFKRKRRLKDMQQKNQQTIAISSTTSTNQIDTTTLSQLITATASSTLASDNSLPKFVNNSTCALAAEGSLKTKLISAVEARSTKSIVSRFKNSINSASKCHKCGTAGYYRSICPNCSPIYHYKPSTNR